MSNGIFAKRTQISAPQAPFPGIGEEPVFCKIGTHG